MSLIEKLPYTKRMPIPIPITKSLTIPQIAEQQREDAHSEHGGEEAEAVPDVLLLPSGAYLPEDAANQQGECQCQQKTIEKGHHVVGKAKDEGSAEAKKKKKKLI